jgi:hypothetical protein
VAVWLGCWSAEYTLTLDTGLVYHKWSRFKVYEPEPDNKGPRSQKTVEGLTAFIDNVTSA